jgi:hypothetical protein
MPFNSQHFVLLSLARQFVNCWLAYVVSQPVDFDLSVMLHFVREYFGITMIISFLKRNTTIVASQFMNDDSEQTLDDLVAQESYS